ncbi:MAG: RimK family alpha-L-glutamate ligase [Anaerolineae bacterium]|jgi:glutathione synthase/RimK-type ligase-like ATP-grasp enzyme
MIFLCGIPSEPSLGLVIEQLRVIGAPHVVFNQRRFAGTAMEFTVQGGQVDGWMQLEGRQHRLADFRAVYTRLMDHRRLPEVEREPSGSALRLYCQALHTTITRWYEIAPARVLNRYEEIGSNYSKPYQAQLLLEQGFAVPETLITNQPDLVREFQRNHGRVIYKSISAVRSIVQTLRDEDLLRLNAIRACPVQFQEFVDGINMRVHTIGSTHVFAVTIRSAATDYRYAHLQGEQEQLEAVELDDALAERCLRLAQALGLEFAGIDLKIRPDGTAYCLEVNACPAFSYYEIHTGQPIARAVAGYLAAAV